MNIILKQVLKVRHKKYILIIVLAFIILKIFGILTLLHEIDFNTNFHYPYDGDIQEAIYQLRHGQTPDIKPINSYDYVFIHNQSNKCKNPGQTIRIVYLIKSDPKHFNRRSIIRNTWGFEKRFSDVEIRRIFILGYRENSNLQLLINDEAAKYFDIVQANFTDAYYNNTLKTMMSFKWATTFCNSAKFYMFVDDDYYISTKNVLRYLRHPTNYPKYLQEAILSVKNVVIKKRQLIDLELPDDVKLYTGYVFNSKPLRYLFSKWYMSLEEYPYNKWPPYVTAGAFILSREALLDMYYASFYTKHFRFDDIYVAILSLKAKIEPFHSDEFYYYRKDYSKESYTFTIASHGFEEPSNLMTLWNEQKSLGNA